MFCVCVCVHILSGCVYMYVRTCVCGLLNVYVSVWLFTCACMYVNVHVCGCGFVC